MRVVTNDNLIRLSALRSGVLRESAAVFYQQVLDTLAQMRRLLDATQIKPATIRWPDEQA